MRQRLLSMRSSGIFSFALLIYFAPLRACGMLPCGEVAGTRPSPDLPLGLKLNVEDDGGFVASGGALNGGLVPGDGFDGAAQFVTLRVVRFTGNACRELCLRDSLNFTRAHEQKLGVEEENQLIEPVDQQGNEIMAARSDLSAGKRAHLIGRNHQTLHAQRRVGE